MSTVSSLRRASGLLATVFFLTLPAPGQAQTEFESAATDPALGSEPEGDPEEGAIYARLRYFEGGVSLKREDEEAARGMELAVNTPLIPGDQIWTGEDGRVEIQLADGTILRLDRNSRLSLLNLADREGSFDNTTLIRLLNGSLYVHADTFDPRARRFQIDTPAGSVFLLSGGLYRVDVAYNGVSTVASYRGVAEFLAEDVSMIAHSGERVTGEPGRAPGGSRAFNTLRRDSFDHWSESMDDAAAGADSARGPRPEVPEPVRPYMSELNRYGVWRNDPSYGWIWIPDDLDSEWRPYYYGQWSYAPIGPVWVSYEPWGWAPYHYGRWHWGVGVGWFWSPGWIFSGAYVSWSIGPSFFGWCPLGFYDYPVYYGSYYPWVYVPHAHFYSGHVHRHTVGWADAARHRFASDGIILRSHPTVRPGYGLEQAGKTTYRRALSNPSYVKDLPSKGSWAKRASFRDAEQTSYRQIAARRASPEANGKAPRLKTPGPRGGAIDRPGSGAPGASPRQPALSSQPAGGSRVRPISARRATGNGGISPATGMPLQPPVRVTPRRLGEEPKRARERSDVLRKNEPAEPSEGAPPVTRRPGAATPGDGVDQRSNGGTPASPTHAHPRIEPGRKGTGRVPFVMPKRSDGSGSKPPAVNSRGGSRPPSARPGPARPAAPSKQGGGKKKGDKN